MVKPSEVSAGAATEGSSPVGPSPARSLTIGALPEDASVIVGILSWPFHGQISSSYACLLAAWAVKGSSLSLSTDSFLSRGACSEKGVASSSGCSLRVIGLSSP